MTNKTMKETIVVDNVFNEIIAGIKSGQVIPYLGPGALQGATNKNTGEAIPADSDSLIYAMNDGKPMAPKLMYEFPRAAMNLELKRGRSFVNKFLTKLYRDNEWTRSPLHEHIAHLKPHYVIDINRDTQLQESYHDIPHTLIVGLSRIAGTDYRFKIYQFDGCSYGEVEQEQVNPTLPVLFKPMGTPMPEPNYIASDADYVDYITELMGGFAIPSFMKEYRKDKQYVFLGMRMQRDTERMVLSDISFGSGTPRGWALIPEPTAKEQRFCARQNITVIDAEWSDLFQSDAQILHESEDELAKVGC
jgi:hypothetical protein